MRIASLLLLLSLLLSCASFDKTNILPGQKVPALGFSFKVPTEKSWFAVLYGNSNRIHLSQHNGDDSYAIKVALNRGPYRGMYQTAESHLLAYQRTRYLKRPEKGFIEKSHQVEPANAYGDICIRYEFKGENWHGRNNEGPALIETIGLTCSHKTIRNVLVNIELTRRFETYAQEINLQTLADDLFNSIEYEET